jgi:hypothetical protein
MKRVTRLQIRCCPAQKDLAFNDVESNGSMIGVER